jgi:uncharacterized protein (DUF1684 family)
MPTAPDPLALADWRRTVADLYRAVRDAAPGDAPAACARFRAARDELFRTHPATPLDASRLARFRGLRYYPYDPAWRVEGALDWHVARETAEVDLGADGPLRYTRVAAVRFRSPRGSGALSLFWIEGYGGGLFLPFRDTTNGAATFGGGRYLYDTIKGADLGRAGASLLLDFNYAYNPSCAYGDRWTCPLAPEENHLSLPVGAGERGWGGAD